MKRRMRSLAWMLLWVALWMAVGVASPSARAGPGTRPTTGPAPDDVGSIVPTLLRPVVVPADDAALHGLWADRVAAYMATPVDRVAAHPAAADFPGGVPAGTPTVSRDVAVALNLPRWHSTGLYAAPGARLTVTVGPADARRGLSIVIGSHTDDLTKLGKWTRFPRVGRRFPIAGRTTVVASAFGGLVYVDVPRDERLGGRHVSTFGGYGWLDEDRSAVPGVVHVRVDGGVAAPLFVAGRTTAQQWAEQLRASAAPWGELASDEVVLTVQAKHLPAVADPEALLAFWGRVIDAEAKLAGWPKQPAPPERIVVDRDISAGWMHSGYPIMAHLGSEKSLLDVAALRAKGDWGFLHELGHNHEGQAYTFGGDYVEVDVNLFTMYAMQQVVGREMTAHPALAHLDPLIEARLGPAHRDDAWGNLAMYVETIQAFGWPPLEQTLATYSAPGGGDGLKTREQKMDQWVLRYSRATGHDLAPYYAAFGVTCAAATRAATSGLPAWMPPAVAKYAKP